MISCFLCARIYGGAQNVRQAHNFNAALGLVSCPPQQWKDPPPEMDTVYAQRFKWVLVICPTSFTGDWGAIVGPENVLPVFDAAQVETLMERQAELREDGIDIRGVSFSMIAWAVPTSSHRCLQKSPARAVITALPSGRASSTITNARP